MNELKKVKAKDLRRMFKSDPITYVFPLYAINNKPEALAYAVSAVGNKISGGILDTAICETETVQDLHLIAENAENAELLLEFVYNSMYNRVFYLPKHFESFLSKFNFKQQAKLEYIYVLDSSIDYVPVEEIPVVKLNPSLLSRLKLNAEISPFIGSPSTFPETDRFFGLVYQNNLIGCAEAIVQSGRITAVEQVFVLSAYRNRGLASHLIKTIIMTLKHEIETFVLRIESDNFASQKLAESLGFRLHSEIICVS